MPSQSGRSNNAVQVFVQWRCCNCHYLNTWGRQLQCVNWPCQHAYCKDDCDKIRTRVRVDANGSSSRRS
ncbi:hypothetical protein NEMBOFW57_001516 [Staphylotrichum longicolle]|uniref:Uncharacterized protein n=1 Tax=Staphylotrichum longicolle TaxID=669026 RepID=A0AAD4I0W6_9PEZI|nr:hypothetical protein NEMBOFW57_001516 [Staphylotrichum longicolle]